MNHLITSVNVSSWDPTSWHKYRSHRRRVYQMSHTVCPAHLLHAYTDSLTLPAAGHWKESVECATLNGIKATHTLSPDLLMKKISMAKRIKKNLIFSVGSSWYVFALELTDYTLYFQKIFQELSVSRNGHVFKPN
jgi:hypothetical protein